MEEFQKVSQGRVPAPQTMEFFKDTNKKFDNMETSMNEVMTNMQLMKKDISVICDKLEQHTIDQKEQFKELTLKIDGFITSADTRYAEKNMERVIYRVFWTIGWLIVGAIASAIFRLIFK
jgi:hypothetical protein